MFRDLVMRIPNDNMMDGCATIEASNRLLDHETIETEVPICRLDDYEFGSWFGGKPQDFTVFMRTPSSVRGVVVR